MRKKILPLVAVFFFPFFAAWAQEAKPIIRFSPFYTQGISVEEIRFIESLIQSYLSDVGVVVNYFDSIMPYGDAFTRAPDFVLTGSIYLERDSRVFTLEIHNTLTRETSRVTTVHATASDLVLRARSTVESIFSTPAIAEAERIERPETITESAITGTWRGESGIELIRLQQGGRGVAFFSSGAQMNLIYTIENNILRVRQDSPNIERFYYPLPYGVAQALSAEADPMHWELLLYSGGTHLRGVRISTEAVIEGDILVELLPGTERDTLWVRR